MNDKTGTTVALVACSGVIGDLIRSCSGAHADLAVVEDGGGSHGRSLNRSVDGSCAQRVPVHACRGRLEL